MNEQDIKNLLVFLDRVQISGNEASTVVVLRQKLITMLQPKEQIEKKEIKKKTK